MTTKDPETIPNAKPGLSEFIEGAVNVANNALSSIVPIFGIVTSLINDILTIHDNAQFNKKMSQSIINRITPVEIIIESLKSPIKYKEELQNLQNQETFVKFQAILKKIKMFTETVTHINAFETFLRAKNIKKEFIKLMKEYEACMNDLNFTMTIVFNEQRRIDNDISTDILSEIKEKETSLYQEICHIKNTETSLYQEIYHIKNAEASLYQEICHIKNTGVSLYQEICHIKNKLENIKASIQQIDPTLLKKPSLNRRSDRRVMIFEWAEKGNLKEVYNKEHISWNLKAQIVFEICKGIRFLDSVGIFHNDIRCENIMMSRFKEPKLANFQFAVQHNDNEKKITINQPIDVVNRMPPEKICKLFTESGNSNQIPYSKKCEIFSFGMLIWELAYQKIPYSNMKSNDVVIHVTRGNREICDNFLDTGSIHESFLDIIQHAWREVPEERINMDTLFSKLEELV
ncbi:kinase-like domain-containing protein [Gigaspora rosea]|uniref:Kinase-like domain-containing protein n=1 Tax=Gigaspora rosea TaxID=44941 RepID=A0A397VFS1_9GLOM|nr:kinase-like domain-containing protein [Gigaspora rosea]